MSRHRTKERLSRSLHGYPNGGLHASLQSTSRGGVCVPGKTQQYDRQGIAVQRDDCITQCRGQDSAVVAKRQDCS